MTTPFLEFKNVSRKFKSFVALSNISFKLNKGEKCALIGPNGAGKSTLFRLMGKAIYPSLGQIIFSEALQDIAWLSEGAPLNNDLTIKEHFKLIANLRGLSKKEYKENKEKLVKEFNLKEHLNSLTVNLSHGTKRRTALAISLMGNPSFLILDEPSSGLDPEEVIRLRKGLNNLAKGITFIIASHNLTELELLTNKLMILKNGKLLYYNTWAKFKEIDSDLEQAYLKVLNN